MLSKEVKDNTDKGMYISAAGFNAIRDGVEIALEDIKRIPQKDSAMKQKYRFLRIGEWTRPDDQFLSSISGHWVYVKNLKDEELPYNNGHTTRRYKMRCWHMVHRRRV